MNHQRSDDGLKNQVAAHLNLDQLNGVSTKKGCYVGQETYTAYMHHVLVFECNEAASPSDASRFGAVNKSFS